MSIRVAAWNVEGRLSRRTHHRRGTPEHILNGIRRLDADVIALPEAYYKAPAQGIDDALRRLGYQLYDARYEDRVLPSDTDDRQNVHIRLLSRLLLENVRQMRFDDVRTLLCATVCDPESGSPVRIIATHLDDRSEVLRMGQVKEIARYIRQENLPVMMLGDFNAVWDSPLARLMRSKLARTCAGWVPHRWFRTVATRFVDMASGTTLDYLATHAKLHDADRRRQATATPKLRSVEWLPSVRMAQLDHILLSSDLAADNVSVASDGGSDHRAISTTVHFR